jgi:hypothetical protein
MTGEGLTSAYLADDCNRSSQEAWALAQEAIERTDRARAAQAETSGDLDASISIVHGAQRIATNEESLPAMYAAFEAWIEDMATHDVT